MSAIRQQKRRTVQSSARASRELGVGLLFNMVHAGEIIAPWWSKHRDRQLRDFAPSSDHFQGAMWMIGAKLANVPFTIEPRDRSIKRHQRLADQYQVVCQNMIQFGQGWSEFWSLFFRDLWTTDNGAFAEVLDSRVNKGKPLKGPATGLNHLDSLRCNRTSDPEWPVTYQDFDGKRYEFHHTRIIYTSQEPDADGQMHGVGHCWLSRTINNAQQLVDQDVYYQEALGSRPMREFLLGRGIATNELIDAIRLGEEGMDNQNLRRYSKTVIVGDPNRVDIGIDRIPLSFLPDGYDKQQQTSIAMFVIALAGGFPPRWLWPATAAGATKADAMFQHISGVGGGAQWHLNKMRDLLSYSNVSGNVPGMLPPKFLPKELKLTFDFQDDEQDRQQAEIQDKRANTRKTDVEVGVITVRVAREQALADGDLTAAQFAQMELEDGRLADGDDVLTLFDSADPLMVEMLDLDVEEPLAIDANDAIEMMLAIEAQALAAQRRMVQARSSVEKEKARQAIEALGKLKGIYEEIVGKEIEEQLAAEQAAGEFELPETPAAPAGEGEAPEEAEEKAQQYTKLEAGYQEHEVEGIRCGTCRHLLACTGEIDTEDYHYTTCHLVQGIIDADDVCNLWELCPLIAQVPETKDRTVDRLLGRMSRDEALETIVSAVLLDVTKDRNDYAALIDQCIHGLIYDVKSFRFGARVGERIRGGLFRGRGGKFASEADISGIKSEILGRLIARLRAARAAGKVGRAKKPKKPKGGAAKKPKKSPEQLAKLKRAKQQAAMNEVFGVKGNLAEKMGLERNDILMLEKAVLDGAPIDKAQAVKFAQLGLMRFDSDGEPFVTAPGRSIILNAARGDVGGASAALARGKGQAERIRARAGRKQKQAEAASKRAADLRERADDVAEEAGDLDDDADELLAQASAEQDEGKATKLRERAERLQERAEKKREQAEDLQERAAGQGERADTLNAEAGALNASVGAGEQPAPAGEEVPPTEETPPTGEEAPTDEEAPPTDEEAPPDEEAPAGERPERPEAPVAAEPTLQRPPERPTTRPAPEAPPEPEREPTQEDIDLLASVADNLNAASVENLRQLIAAGLVDLGDIPGQVAPRLTAAGEAALKKKELEVKTLEGFTINVRAAIRGLWLGEFDQFDFVENMVSAIERGFEQAWSEGAARCGIQPDERTAEESAALQEIINSQFVHLPGFAADIAAGDKASGAPLTPHLTRGELWTGRYTEVIQRAQAMSCANQKLKWVLGEAEHCSSCLRLDGKVKRASFWHKTGILPRVAGASYLECRGYNCQCRFVETDDRVSRGPLPGLP